MKSIKNSHNSPFKFNGKELDEESGLYYYGARYYDPRISIWASVDPLVEQTMDAYGYCYQNPINLIDPTGMSPEEEGGDPGKKGWLSNAWSEVKSWFSDKPKGTAELGGHVEATVVNDDTSFLMGNNQAVNESYKPTAIDMAFREVIGLKGRLIYDGIAAMTGQERHKYGPDAISLAKAVEGGAYVGGTVSAGGIVLLKGTDAGIYGLGDVGAGLSTISISTGFSGFQYFYTGNTKDLKNDTFAGPRTAVGISVDIGPSVGIGGSWGSTKGGKTYTLGGFFGLGVSPHLIDGNVNYGNTYINQ